MALLGRMAWVCSLTKEWRPVTFGIIWFIFGMVGTVSAGDSETWANQSQGLFPFMGLMLAVMSSVANVFQTGCAGVPRRKLLTIPLVCVTGAFVVAVHTVGTYQLNDSSIKNLAPTEISGLDRPPSQSQRL